MKSIFEYKLWQQAPMIHFQSDEPGACLRASEIKSKLDKFLHQNVEKIPGSWYVNREQSKALNYKVKVQAQHPAKQPEPNKNLYFGNLGKGKGGKRPPTVMYLTPISLKIVCFNPSLMEAIQEHIEGFFLLHNFGTRQNKGFGSFVLEDTLQSNAADQLLAKYTGASRRIYKVRYDEDTPYEAIFKDIRIFSDVLKSGYNQEKYIKSFLVNHCLDRENHGGKRLGGDKRWLKSKVKMAPVVKKRRTTEAQHTEVDGYRYNRALLGSAGNLAYIRELDNNDKPDRYAGKTRISVTGKSKVKRIPSPVVYKIVGSTLYMIVNQHSEAVYGKWFRFSVGKRGTNGYREEELQVPRKDEVDIQKVFADYVATVNRTDSTYHVDLKNMLDFMKQNKTIETIGEGVK